MPAREYEYHLLSTATEDALGLPRHSALASTLNRPRLPEAWARSGEAPLWVAICLYAAARAEGGMLRLEPSQLRKALVPDLNQQNGHVRISQAIHRAKVAGWIGAGSTARCIILARPPR